MKYRSIALLFALLCTSVLAEEGMWTLDNLPRQALARQYQFDVTPAWSQTVQKASLRLAGGCSGSFVSAQGLVLTNHHCVSRCIAQLSSRDENLLEAGFVARELNQEAICPEIEVNQLLDISDVTQSIHQTIADLSPQQAVTARKAAMSELEAGCGQGDHKLRCEVVTLYEGGRYHLYKYRRYQDVRLVFAPETQIAAFGGDPDNFSFPRYALDMSLLRVYDEGQPVQSKHYFRVNPAGAQVDELVFVTGHPGTTRRAFTVAQLVSLRDLILPQRMSYLAELRGVLRQFATVGPEQERISRREYLGIENTLKAFRGRHAALSEPGFMEARRSQEYALRERVHDKRALRKTTAGAWDEIAKAQLVWRDIYTDYSMLELMRGYQSDLLAIARHLVRAAQERPKPNAQRLREYTDAALPQLTQRLFSAAPIHPELERLSLGWSLEKLREFLGPDHPAVRLSLGVEAPQALADRLIRKTQLADLSIRKALWDGGAAAIAASADPLIEFARRIDGPARAVRARQEQDIQAVVETNSTLISQARFQLDGTDNYPDASFSLRLSYGQVKAWTEKGREIEPFTTVAGAMARATGQAPFAFPPSWLAAETQLKLTTPMNFVTTHDIIGGNSGSPMINRKTELVGLVFDGNLHSLGGAYAYDGRYNRAVAVHPAAMKLALETVYAADHLVDELFSAP